MKCVGIKAQAGYWSPQARKARSVSCRPPSPLTIHPDAPDERWVTDITYIRTHEGWLCIFSVVVDLSSHKIIGSSIQSRMTKDIAMNALMTGCMAA